QGRAGLVPAISHVSRVHIMPWRHLVTVKTVRTVVVVAGFVALSSLGLRGSNSDRRAHLSSDLTDHQARRTTARKRVIVHGAERDLDLLAWRHRLQVVRRMHGAAVVL